MRSLSQLVAHMLCVTALFCSTGSAATLFYNGDVNLSQNGNFLDCTPCAGRTNDVYDNFTVASPGGWTATGMSGSFLENTTPAVPANAYWEIRQGISQGNSGTLVASGTSSITWTQIVTPAGGSSQFAYYFATIGIGSVNLTPGNYWMTLSPNGASSETFVLGTFGANGVNAITDGTSFAEGTSFPTMTNIGGYLKPFTGSSNYDWSYGITGNVNAGAPTPEPSTLLMLGSGVGLVLLARKLR